LGDALKEILCIPYAVAQKYNNNSEWKHPLKITTKIISTQQTFLVSLAIDRINQTIHTEIEELKGREEAESNFTEIEVRLPIIEDILDLNKMRRFLVDYATINMHIGFTFNLPSSSSSESNGQENTLNFSQIQSINTKWTNISSIYYYSLSEFRNFIFGLDKSNDEAPIYNILQRTFREVSNIKKVKLTELSVGQLKKAPQHIEQIYLQLRNTMKPPSNLSLPFNTNRKIRMEALKKRLEQRPSFRVSDIKYKSQFGYHKSDSVEFPFFFEIAVVSSNSVPYYLD
jgi:hypothetical protein